MQTVGQSKMLTKEIFVWLTKKEMQVFVGQSEMQIIEITA